MCIRDRLCIRPHGVSFAVAFFWELRSWCRPDRANAAIAGTSDASRNVVDSVISATPWRRLRCSGTNCVLGPAYNETRAHHTRTYPSRRHHNTPPGHTAITGLTPTARRCVAVNSATAQMSRRAIAPVSSAIRLSITGAIAHRLKGFQLTKPPR